MMSRYPGSLFPDRTLVVPPLFCGPVEHYVRIACYGNSYTDSDMKFDKRCKRIHRTVIADVHGPLRLTVPVAKPFSATAARWSDIIISSHGNWPEVHRTALESAYGRTPYFEFYADRFLPLLIDAPRPVTELNAAFDREIRRILLLPLPVEKLSDEMTVDRDIMLDIPPPEYWQVRRDRLGFIPGLSVLDLIFNVGPEAPLILRSAASSAKLLPPQADTMR